jgi:NADH dehydrogenase
MTMEKTVLVTGAAGFVGEYVLEALQETAFKIKGLVRREPQGRKLREKGIEPVIGDVTRPETLSDALSGVDAIIHLAAVNRNQGEATMEAINYRGTINLLGAARAAGVQRLVQVIGIGADSRRTSPLSRTQGLAAEAVIRSEVPGTVLEAGVIFGRGDAFGTMLTGLARISPLAVTPGDGKARFEPIAVQDVALAAVNALDMLDSSGQRYEIVGPDILTLDEIVDLLLDAAGIKRLKLHMPPTLLRPPARIMERFLPEPPVTSALLDLLELDIQAQKNASAYFLGRRPLCFKDNLDYVRDVMAGKFLGIIFGRLDRRGLPI